MFWGKIRLAVCYKGLPRWLRRERIRQQCRRPGLDPWRREWPPLHKKADSPSSVFLPVLQPTACVGGIWAFCITPVGLWGSVQSLSCVQLFVTPWTAACQASLSITSSQSLLKLMSIESVGESGQMQMMVFILFPVP